MAMSKSSESHPDDRHAIPVRRTSLAEQGAEDDLHDTTAGERLAMVWQLTLDAWAFLENSDRESRLPRHVDRVIRGGS